MNERLRFRIDVKRDREGAWVATIYDFDDNGGSDMPYAEVWTSDLMKSLESAIHYVRVAE